MAKRQRGSSTSSDKHNEKNPKNPSIEEPVGESSSEESPSEGSSAGEQSLFDEFPVKRPPLKKQKSLIEDSLPEDEDDDDDDEDDEPVIEELPAEQLKKLYGFMKEIKALEPWKRLWDTDFICIELPGNEEPVFCSVMGRNQECFGISVYPGFESATSLFRLISSEDESPMALLGYTNSINCYFGNRDELDECERQQIKDLGLSFRGKNNWPYFRRTYPGCLPWHLSIADGDILEKILEQFITAYTHFADEKITVNFEEDEVIYHVYSKKAKDWITEVRPLPQVPLYRETYIIDNEIFAGSLKMKPINGCEIETDTLYFPLSPGLNKRGIPAVMRLILIMDPSKGVLDQIMLRPDDDIAEGMIQILANYINKYGRPMLIRVRDEWMEALLMDLCKKTEITLNCEEGVPCIDDFSEQLMNSGFLPE